MNGKKILFVEPAPLEKRTAERLAGCSYELYHFPDLANLYIFTLLHKYGFQLNYIDAVLEKIPESKFWEAIRSYNPDYCLLHSVILSKPTDLAFIHKLSRLNQDTKIIVYGPEPTRAPEDYLISPKVIVFRGEVEDNLVHYFTEGKLIGVSLLEKKTFLHIPPSGSLVDLDNLPIPYRNHQIFLPYLKKYFNPKFKGTPFTTMMTSRGCIFNCIFCVPISINFARELEYKKYFGKKPPLKIANPQRVILEFQEIKKQGFNSVMIVDDQFLWEESRTIQICEGIKDLKLEWGCLSRADFLTNKQIIKTLADAGCRSIDIGVESLNQKALNYINKNLKVETIITAIKLLNDYAIEPKLNIMLGCCPDESPQDIISTIDKLKDMKLKNIMFSIATPFKGTDFYNICKEQGYLTENSTSIDPLSKSIINYTKLSNKTLENLVRYAYRSFYLRPQIIFNRIKKYKKIGDLIKDLTIGFKLFRRR
ncbi:MAG: radical SAM protein [Candidatus Omnitrophica bacterium]|nr:radical SAM protein [Candidatus Omnitrophota bacterium]